MKGPLADVAPASGRRVGGLRAWALAFGVSGALYAATSAPGLLWGDSGETQLHVLLRQWLVSGQICRSHVAYYALTRALVALTDLSAARAANLSAALFGAITVANAAYLLGCWRVRRLAVVCGVLLLMLSHTLWRLSTGAEVLSLTTALMTAEWIAVTQFVQTRRAGWAVLVGVCNGLGVATHNLALLSWPAYALLAIPGWKAGAPLSGTGTAPRSGSPLSGTRRAPRAGGPLRAACAGLVGWLAGASPLLALMLATFDQLGGATATLHSWLVGAYAGGIMNVSNLPALCALSAGYVVMNFPTPVLILGLPGWWALRSRVPRSLWTFMTVHAAVLLAFVVRYNVADQYTFFAPVHVIIALSCAVGIEAWVAPRPGGPGRRARVRREVALLGACTLAPLAYATVPLLMRAYWPRCPLLPTRQIAHRDAFNWFLQPWRVGDDGTERFLNDLFDALPPDAMLFSDSQFASAIVYAQVSDARRRDIRLDPWRDAQGWLAPPVDAETLRRHHLRSGTYFVGSTDAGYLPNWLEHQPVRFEPVGPVYRVVMEDSPP
ncbi:MAG: DUF2723 domain-containing protein [Phycisphaerales bacterium]|nr:DUF2723 domain-containing protein [Phycisphaerales bacterium]